MAAPAGCNPQCVPTQPRWPLGLRAAPYLRRRWSGLLQGPPEKRRWLKGAEGGRLFTASSHGRIGDVGRRMSTQDLRLQAGQDTSTLDPVRTTAGHGLLSPQDCTGLEHEQEPQILPDMGYGGGRGVELAPGRSLTPRCALQCNPSIAQPAAQAPSPRPTTTPGAGDSRAWPPSGTQAPSLCCVTPPCKTQRQKHVFLAERKASW